VYRRLGYTTMIEYMERELYWGPHAAKERLRVARELTELPLIAELFRDGELCFSAARELTRVATPATEEAFLRKAQGKTAHHIQQMVAGLKRGDEPDAKPDPRRITKRVVIEVSAETYAMWRRTRTALEDQSGERLSDDDFLQTVCRRATETSGPTDDVPRPAVQTALTTCKACKQSFVEGGGQALPIDEATAARLTCDAEHIGDLESDELTRVTPTIPAAIRRKVFHRDHFACVVPGCRATRHLDLHHVLHREDGGDHSMGNIAVMCFGCHQRHHAGQLTITGRPSSSHGGATTTSRVRWRSVPAGTGYPSKRPRPIERPTRSTSAARNDRARAHTPCCIGGAAGRTLDSSSSGASAGVRVLRSVDRASTVAGYPAAHFSGSNREAGVLEGCDE
jgi:hypothetical protein